MLDPVLEYLEVVLRQVGNDPVVFIANGGKYVDDGGLRLQRLLARRGLLILPALLLRAVLLRVSGWRKSRACRRGGAAVGAGDAAPLASGTVVAATYPVKIKVKTPAAMLLSRIV